MTDIGKTTAAALASFAQDLASHRSLEEVLDRVVASAAVQIPGAQAAGIMLLVKGQVTTPASSDEIAHEVDMRQGECGEGPCISASLDESDMVQTDDLQQDERWPAFAAAVEPLGIRSMLSCTLFSPHERYGALNLYSREPNAFDDASRDLLKLFAAHAAIAMDAAKRHQHLQVALQSRDVIGQAKGILMERFKIDDVEAFDLLVAVSQRANRKLRDVAETLATTGEVPLPA